MSHELDKAGQSRRNFLSKDIPRLLTVAALVTVGVTGKIFFDDWTDNEGSQETGPSKVEFLYPDKEQLTVDEFIRQFDLVFNEGIKVVRGVGAFRLDFESLGGHTSLIRDVFGNGNVDIESRQTRFDEGSYGAPDQPGQVNKVKTQTLTLGIIGSDEPNSLRTNDLIWEYGDSMRDVKEDPITSTPTPQDFLYFAKQLVENFNWAVENRSIQLSTDFQGPTPTS